MYDRRPSRGVSFSDLFRHVMYVNDIDQEFITKGANGVYRFS